MEQETLAAILAELKSIHAVLAERSGSSVELSNNAKAGELKCTVKEYAGSEPPVADALANFTALMQGAAEQQMNGWAITAEEMRRAS